MLAKRQYEKPTLLTLGSLSEVTKNVGMQGNGDSGFMNKTN